MVRSQNVLRIEGVIAVRAEAEIVAGGREVVRAVAGAAGLVAAEDGEAAVAGMVATVVVAEEDTRTWPRIFTDQHGLEPRRESRLFCGPSLVQN